MLVTIIGFHSFHAGVFCVLFGTPRQLVRCSSMSRLGQLVPLIVPNQKL